MRARLYLSLPDRREMLPHGDANRTSPFYYTAQPLLLAARRLHEPVLQELWESLAEKRATEPSVHAPLGVLAPRLWYEPEQPTALGRQPGAQRLGPGGPFLCPLCRRPRSGDLHPPACGRRPLFPRCPGRGVLHGPGIRPHRTAFPECHAARRQRSARHTFLRRADVARRGYASLRPRTLDRLRRRGYRLAVGSVRQVAHIR